MTDFQTLLNENLQIVNTLNDNVVNESVIYNNNTLLNEGILARSLAAITSGSMVGLLSAHIGATFFGMPFVSVVGFTGAAAGAAIGGSFDSIGEFLFGPGKQLRTFSKMMTLVDKRDHIFKAIDKGGYSEEEAIQKFGNDIDRLTDQIKQEANKLLHLIQGNEGRTTSPYYHNLTQRDIIFLEQLLEAGTEGAISNYFVQQGKATNLRESVVVYNNKDLIDSVIKECSMDPTNEVIYESVSGLISRAKNFFQRRRINKISTSVFVMGLNKVLYITSDDTNIITEMVFYDDDIIDTNELTMDEVEERVKHLTEQGYSSVNTDKEFVKQFRQIFRGLVGSVSMMGLLGLMLVVGVSFIIGITEPDMTHMLYLSGIGALSAISSSIGTWYIIESPDKHFNEYTSDPIQ